jgi:hypothetical protein
MHVNDLLLPMRVLRKIYISMAVYENAWQTVGPKFINTCLMDLNQSSSRGLQQRVTKPNI